MGSVVTYHFPARGKKPPVTMKWIEKGYPVPKPKRWDQKNEMPGGGGMYMEGTKETLFHAGMRPNSPQLTPNDMLHCLETGVAIEGPLSVETSRIGQQIVDAAVRSAAEGRAVAVEAS